MLFLIYCEPNISNHMRFLLEFKHLNLFWFVLFSIKIENKTVIAFNLFLILFSIPNS